MKRSVSGFTLIELMIVMAIIAVIASIAIPNLMKSRITANQSNAGAALKQLIGHEQTWKQGDFDRNGVLDYWTRDVGGLYAVYDNSGTRPLAVIDRAFASADKNKGAAYPELSAGALPKQGYFYQAMTTDQSGSPYVVAAAPAPVAKNAPAGPCTNTSRFGFTAFPSIYGTDGTYSFIVGEDGVIWQQDLGSSNPVTDRGAASPETPNSGWSQFGG